MEFYENGGGASRGSVEQRVDAEGDHPAEPALPGSAIRQRRINFQPAASPVPAGYLKDDGAVYGARGNGYTTAGTW